MTNNEGIIAHLAAEQVAHARSFDALPDPASIDTWDYMSDAYDLAAVMIRAARDTNIEGLRERLADIADDYAWDAICPAIQSLLDD